MVHSSFESMHGMFREPIGQVDTMSIDNFLNSSNSESEEEIEELLRMGNKIKLPDLPATAMAFRDENMNSNQLNPLGMGGSSLDFSRFKSKKMLKQDKNKLDNSDRKSPSKQRSKDSNLLSGICMHFAIELYAMSVILAKVKK